MLPWIHTTVLLSFFLSNPSPCIAAPLSGLISVFFFLSFWGIGYSKINNNAQGGAVGSDGGDTKSDWAMAVSWDGSISLGDYGSSPDWQVVRWLGCWRRWTQYCEWCKLWLLLVEVWWLKVNAGLGSYWWHWWWLIAFLHLRGEKKSITRSSLTNQQGHQF